MPADQEVLELLRREPTPPMHVDLAGVVAEGSRRTRRRRAQVVAAAALVAAAVVVATVTLSPGPDRRATPPMGTTTGHSTPGPSSWRPPGTDRSGSATITAANASYAVVVRDGLLTVRTTRGDHTGSPQVAALLNSGAAWRVVDGTSGQPAVVGVVPGRASTVALRPVEGETLPEHTVSLAAAGDFTAFVATFAQPLGRPTPAADIGWGLAGSPLTWALGADMTPVALSVTMQGEGSAPLPPYDFTRTGPPKASASHDSVVVWVGMSSNRIGSEITATLQGDLTVRDPEGQRTKFLGADPETSVGYSTFQLRDGRTLTWGVLPPGAFEVQLHLEGSARSGVPVYQRTLEQWTAFAVLVDGSPEQVTGLQAILAGNGRHRLSLLR